MAGALLHRHLVRLRVDAEITTAGTMSEGQPPTERAVRLLAERGIDVSEHRSRRLDDVIVKGADLIVTAEQAHVVWIAGRWPEQFAATFTLPELVGRLASVNARQGTDIRGWLTVVGKGRPEALDYLDARDIPEIADPTGQAPAVWDRSYAEIDALTRKLAERLV